MPHNPHLAEVLFKYSMAATERLAGADAAETVRVASNVAAFAESGWLSDAQLDALSAALGDMEVPDGAASYAEEMSTVLDAVADLSAAVSDNAEGQAVLEDAVADLSEAVSALAGGE